MNKIIIGLCIVLSCQIQSILGDETEFFKDVLERTKSLLGTPELKALHGKMESDLEEYKATRDETFDKFNDRPYVFREQDLLVILNEWKGKIDLPPDFAELVRDVELVMPLLQQGPEYEKRFEKQKQIFDSFVSLVDYLRLLLTDAQTILQQILNGGDSIRSFEEAITYTVYALKCIENSSNWLAIERVLAEYPPIINTQELAGEDEVSSEDDVEHAISGTDTADDSEDYVRDDEHAAAAIDEHGESDPHYESVGQFYVARADEDSSMGDSHIMNGDEDSSDEDTSDEDTSDEDTSDETTDDEDSDSEDSENGDGSFKAGMHQDRNDESKFEKISIILVFVLQFILFIQY